MGVRRMSEHATKLRQLPSKQVTDCEDKVSIVPSTLRPRSSWLFLLCLIVAIKGDAADLPLVPPAELVSQTVNNELSLNSHVKFMFQDRKQTPHGSQTKLMVETTEAMAGMVIAYDDRPLNPQQRQDELARIQRFTHDPAELHKKRKQEQENEDRIARIMKALPTAFLYEYDGVEPGTPGVGDPGVELLRLRFRPNPKYDPPSRVEQVLTTMTGVLLIDPRRKRLARIDGTLSHEVGFGWGIFGHLDKGGHFLVEQGNVEHNHWEITRTDLAITGKVLLFKTIRFESSERFSNFREVSPDLTFAQGVELLTREADVAENRLRHTNGQAAK